MPCFGGCGGCFGRKDKKIKRSKSMDINPNQMIKRAYKRLADHRKAKVGTEEKAEVDEAGNRESTAPGAGIPSFLLPSNYVS